MKIYSQRIAHDHLSEAQLATIEQQYQSQHYLYLDFDTRQRSRFKATTQDGETVGVDLPRTDTLKDGCVLSDGNTNVLQIKAAKQRLIAVSADDGFSLMQGAYHLGNRHVPLMITPDILYFEPDHVLEAMLQNLGLHTTPVQAPFEPETGAYKGEQAHSHSHSHAHSGDAHSHAHAAHTHSESHSHSHD